MSLRPTWTILTCMSTGHIEMQTEEILHYRVVIGRQTKQMVGQKNRLKICLFIIRYRKIKLFTSFFMLLLLGVSGWNYFFFQCLYQQMHWKLWVSWYSSTVDHQLSFAKIMIARLTTCSRVCWIVPWNICMHRTKYNSVIKMTFIWQLLF